jgi:hypothetical protein
MIPITGCIDSFAMAAAMAASGCPRVYRRRAVVGFMIFDFLASCFALPFSPPRALVVFFAFAFSILLIHAGTRRPALYLLVPVLCCLDNLFGASGGPMQFGSAAAEALGSGVLAWAGGAVGGLLRDRLKGAIA